MAVEHSTHNYACTMCGVALVRKGIRGGIPMFCSPCLTKRKQQHFKDRPKPTSQHCQQCHVHVPEGRLFCGRKCSQDSRRRTDFTCPICLVVFHPMRTGVTCCSRECGWKWQMQRKAEARKIREANKPASVRLCLVCGKGCGQTRGRLCSDICRIQRKSGYIAATAARRKSKVEATRPATRKCLVCGRAFPVVYGWGLSGRRLCGRKLCRNRNSRKHGRAKTLSHIQRAKRRGVAFEAGIRRMDIFARDKWTCQLCGRRTPKRLMRSCINDAAPTLDHIVPLAVGGTHTRANLQCACRGCNSAKSHKIIGQSRLF